MDNNGLIDYGKINSSNNRLGEINNIGTTDIRESIDAAIFYNTVPTWPKGSLQAVINTARKYNGVFTRVPYMDKVYFKVEEDGIVTEYHKHTGKKLVTAFTTDELFAEDWILLSVE